MFDKWRSRIYSGSKGKSFWGCDWYSNLFFFFFFTLFFFTILYWFCHTSTWIHHWCTWVPNPEPPSHLPSHIIFTFHFHALEKEMETHSSVLAWRIPGTGEPDGLPSMGLHRVGHDWSDLAAAAELISILELLSFSLDPSQLLLHLNKMFEISEQTTVFLLSTIWLHLNLLMYFIFRW